VSVLSPLTSSPSNLFQGFRETQKQLIEMSEKTAAVDQMKGATLEEISAMVEQIGREFKSKQIQLQPLMQELKSLRQDYMEFESKYQEAKNTYDKVAITLDLDKQSLEKECDAFQEECLREESRYHTLNCLVTLAKIRLQRAEQEKKWNEGNGRMLRDFASFKELYTVSLLLSSLLSPRYYCSGEVLPLLFASL
jgi:intraflagellar transport protein 81